MVGELALNQQVAAKYGDISQHADNLLVIDRCSRELSVCNLLILQDFGEPGRNRTFNQQIKSLLLCQLSYGPTEGASLLGGFMQ